MTPATKTDTRRKILRVIYTFIGIYAFGYWPTRLLSGRGGAQVAMVLLVAMSIPYGATARSLLRGALRGLTIGLLGGFFTARALIDEQTWTERAIWTAILGSSVICFAVGGLFAHLAAKRAERMDKLWD